MKNIAAVALLAGASLVLAGCTPDEDAAVGASPGEERVASGSAATVAPEAVQQRADAARERLQQSEGGRLVLRAIEAHGGLEAWYRAPTSAYTWEYANRGSDLQFKSYLVANNRTRQVYHDLLEIGPYEDPKPVDGAQFAWDGTDAWIAPDSIQQINPRFWATTGYYFEQIPFVLADPNLRYERLPDETLPGDTLAGGAPANSTRYDMVRVGYEPDVGESPGDTYTLYVHPETGRVAAIRYTVTYGRSPGANGNASGDPAETLFYYDDYETVDGLTVATHFRGYRFRDGERGALRNEAWADSISFRRPFDPARLEAPDDARVAPPPGE